MRSLVIRKILSFLRFNRYTMCRKDFSRSQRSKSVYINISIIIIKFRIISIIWNAIFSHKPKHINLFLCKLRHIFPTPLTYFHLVKVIL